VTVLVAISLVEEVEVSAIELSVGVASRMTGSAGGGRGLSCIGITGCAALLVGWSAGCRGAAPGAAAWALVVGIVV